MRVADLYKCWPETTPTLPLQHILTDTHTHYHRTDLVSGVSIE